MSIKLNTFGGLFSMFRYFRTDEADFNEDRSDRKVLPVHEQTEKDYVSVFTSLG